MTPATSPDAPSELPLFPLHAVLFPGAVLPLKVFETRYIDMLARALREESPFGVCLIAHGSEVGPAAEPCALGVSARVMEWAMPQQGVLQIEVRGESRFRIAHCAAQRDGLLRAVVEWLPPTAATPLPEAMNDLVPLLQAVVNDPASRQSFPLPHPFDDAEWVGFRYASFLPIPAKAKQKLLELDDPLLRLSILREFLLQRGLLTAAS